MEKKTVQYKRTLRGSVGAGVGALLNGDGRRYYILEHKDASKFHKAGASQKIIIDQIELGRDEKCQVRFDDSFPTVSRRHAAIVKDGDGWKLVHLSTTNSTLLNGQSVSTEHPLQNGDEIQLSVGGPRLGFLVPAGKQSLVSSIKITERLELFRKQALKPYKTAISVLCVLILLLSSVGGYKLYDLHQKNVEANRHIASIQAENDSVKLAFNSQISGLIAENTNLQETTDRLRGSVSKLSKELKEMKEPIIVGNDELAKDVYFIGLIGYTVTLNSGETYALNVGDLFMEEEVGFICGTGFLLDNGQFITARHVIEPWSFNPQKLLVLLNHIASTGGHVNAHFYAVSSAGNRFDFSTEQFECNRSHDKIKETEIGAFRLAELDYNDFAIKTVSSRGSLSFDCSLSSNLKAGTELLIIGFPLGLGRDTDKAKPSFSSASVSRDGIVEDGYILTTSSGFEQGNSGGPVLVKQNGKKTVIGIVSAGGGRSTGFIVPISSILNR